MGWNWDKFVGTKRGLMFNRRDLTENLEPVLTWVPQKRVVVQAGGNLGVFPKRLSEVFKTVYTFEPDPENFLALCRNAPELNIIKLQAALGDERKQVGISRERIDGLPESHEGTRNIKGDGPIPVLRLDDLGLKVCDLLYLDLEGYEFFALQGATRTIEQCRPVIAVEINKSIVRYGLRDEDMFIQMRVYGYRQVKQYHSDFVFVPKEWPQ